MHWWSHVRAQAVGVSVLCSRTLRHCPGGELDPLQLHFIVLVCRETWTCDHSWPCASQATPLLTELLPAWTKPYWSSSDLFNKKTIHYKRSFTVDSLKEVKIMHLNDGLPPAEGCWWERTCRGCTHAVYTHTAAAQQCTTLVWTLIWQWKGWTPIRSGSFKCRKPAPVFKGSCNALNRSCREKEALKQHSFKQVTRIIFWIQNTPWK